MTSCPQLTEGGQALPGRHFQKAWPVPQPVEGLLRAARSARAGPGGWEAQRLGGPEAGCPSAGRRHPAPRPQLPSLSRFHEWPSFPDSGLAEPPNTRPNQQPWSAWLRVGSGSPLP